MAIYVSNQNFKETLLLECMTYSKYIEFTMYFYSLIMPQKVGQVQGRRYRGGRRGSSPPTLAGEGAEHPQITNTAKLNLATILA